MHAGVSGCMQASTAAYIGMPMPGARMPAHAHPCSTWMRLTAAAVVPALVHRACKPLHALLRAFILRLPPSASVAARWPDRGVAPAGRLRGLWERHRGAVVAGVRQRRRRALRCPYRRAGAAGTRLTTLAPAAHYYPLFHVHDAVSVRMSNVDDLSSDRRCWTPPRNQ
eukprot:365361-Chlamydomonas_euryale.AAC.5